MVSEDTLRLVSDEIQSKREEYLEIMRSHGKMTPAAIVESVAETQAQLLSLFESAPEARAAGKPAPDEWSLHELAQHADFTERLIGKLIHYLGRGAVPPAEDLEGAGIGMMPKPNANSYGEVLAGLRAKNAELLDSVRQLPDPPNTTMVLPHPFFGPLNCLEWAGFQRVHDLDHIHHAEKILAVIPA